MYDRKQIRDGAGGTCSAGTNRSGLGLRKTQTNAGGSVYALKMGMPDAMRGYAGTTALHTLPATHNGTAVTT